MGVSRKSESFGRDLSLFLGEVRKKRVDERCKGVKKIILIPEINT